MDIFAQVILEQCNLDAMLVIIVSYACMTLHSTWVVPAVGGPIWDNWPVDVYASNKSSLTVLSVQFGTELDFNFESS
jgi:hypothetical protein